MSNLSSLVRFYHCKVQSGKYYIIIIIIYRDFINYLQIFCEYIIDNYFAVVILRKWNFNNNITVKPVSKGHSRVTDQ